MIKSSQHTLKYNNAGKQEILDDFLDECRAALRFYVDHLWTNLDGIAYQQAKYMSTEDIHLFDSILSQRALKCIATQAVGMVNAAIAKQRKRIFKRPKLVLAGKSTKKLDRSIMKAKIVKPSVNARAPIEFNSIIAKYSDSDDTTFDGFIEMASMGRIYHTLELPIRMHRHANKLAGMGKMKGSILISNDYVNLRWEIPRPKNRTHGEVIGADQGVRTCVTMSDGQVTTHNPHGHDLNSIQKSLARKKKGSKSFERAQQHRVNYTRWAINQLDFSDIKEFRLEKLYQMRRGEKSSRYLSHFSYPVIRDKIADTCEMNGVHFIEQGNRYRSQRCHVCGHVHKGNRHGKQFTCRACGNECDADLNAACNHAQSLRRIPHNFDVGGLNRTTGFTWTPEGLYHPTGQEITVPDDNENLMF